MVIHGIRIAETRFRLPPGPQKMDIFINTTTSKFESLLTELNFKILKKRKCWDARLSVSDGRFHAMFCFVAGRLYCDFHFDKKFHFLFLGNDHKTRPGIFFREQLVGLLIRERIIYEIVEDNWLTRKNKAIFSGFRL